MSDLKNNPPKIFLAVFIFIVIGAGAITLYRSGRLGPMSRETARGELYYCPMHPTYTSDRAGDCPICNMKLVKREEAAEKVSHEGHLPGETPGTPKIFSVEELMKMKSGEICLLHKCSKGHCLMAMTEELARLGKCPSCGEDLGVIVREALPGGYAPVKLNEQKQKLIGIKTQAVLKRALVKEIRSSGKIAYDPELYQAQGEFLQALQALSKIVPESEPSVRAQAEKLVDSTRIRLKLLGLSPGMVTDIEKAQAPDRSLLYSEAGGSVWLYAPLYEYEIPLVKEGDLMRAEVPSVPGKIFEGRIRSVDSVLDPLTRSVRVRAVLQNPEGILKPEMYVNAVIRVDLGEVLAIPEEAVFETGEKNIVFVAGPEGFFEPREVVLGAKTEDFYEIKSGVLEGEQVVTSGNFLIDSESRLKAALEGIGSGKGSAHSHGQ